MLSVQPGLGGSNDLRVARKMATFQLFFQSREQMVVQWGQIRRIGWVIKTLEAQVGQFILGCKCPWTGVLSCEKKETLGEFPAAFFLQNVLQLHQQIWIILRVDSLAFWKIISEEDAVLIPKKSRWEFFQWNFALGILWGGVSSYAATSLIVALSPGHSDKTRFRPWSPIARDRKSFGSCRKNSKFAQTTGTVDIFDPRSGISGPTSRRVSACPNLHEWWTQPAHVRCSVAQLLI